MLRSAEGAREVLSGTMAGLMVALGGLGVPFGLLGLSRGGAMLICLSAVALGAGAVSLVAQRSGAWRLAVACQAAVFGVVTIWIIAGTPAYWSAAVVFGLLGLAHAGLLSRAVATLQTSLMGLGTALAAGCLAAQMAVDPASIGLWSALALGLCGVEMAGALILLVGGTHGEGDAEQRAMGQLIAGISDGFVHLHRDGRLIFASDGTETMFGCKPFALNGQGLIERIHVLDRPAFLKALSESAHDGATRHIEVRVRRDAGGTAHKQTRFVWAEISFCRAPEGSETESDGVVYGLIRDVTVRKDRQQGLEDARRDAEEASKSKSHFLATMGHELRTPLNAIVGFAEMMSSGIGGQLEPTHAEYADLIGQSGRHLLDVVNMLLDMSRIDAGKFELQLTEFEPENLVEPSLQIVSAAARNRNVMIESNLAPDLPLIKADERACRQILINLLSNAVKFSEPGGSVSVSMRRQGAKLNITVTDHGIGLSRADIERIGEPFFQAHTGLSRQYEGTGLGLSIVKGLVELHDGAMRVRSGGEDGTSFTLLMPILGPEPKSTAETVTQLPRAGTTQKIKPHSSPEKRSVAS